MAQLYYSNQPVDLSILEYDKFKYIGVSNHFIYLTDIIKKYGPVLEVKGQRRMARFVRADKYVCINSYNHRNTQLAK